MMWVNFRSLRQPSRPQCAALPVRGGRAATRGRSPGPGPRIGFTLVELIVVVAIIGLLAALALPALSKSRAASQRMACSNNLRNLALGLHGFDTTYKRLPATGLFFDSMGVGGVHHNWVVQILPYIDQANIYNQFNLDLPISDPFNEPLTWQHIPVLVCPMDITISDDETYRGDLSYVVNGGIGVTVRWAGVGDCPVSPGNGIGPMDLDGDGTVCPASGEDAEDKRYFKAMCLFFIENYNSPGGTSRFHALADIRDGSSQTFMVTENYRVGYNPADPSASFASSAPSLAAFQIGYPCATSQCLAGNVDYSRCIAGSFAINSGKDRPEGTAPVPNSFHQGGVNMVYADGHQTFLSEQIDGKVYAALTSPQGSILDETPLRQQVVSGGF